MAFKTGDRVIYDDCPFLVENVNTKGVGNKYRLHPIKWDKDYPYLDTWIHEDLVNLDVQYYRSEKINELLYDKLKAENDRLIKELKELNKNYGNSTRP